MTAACDVPKTCRPNEITKTIATNTCCQVNECVPQETCKVCISFFLPLVNYKY